MYKLAEEFDFFGDEEEEIDDSTRESLLTKWASLLNKKLATYLKKEKLPSLPNCYGHMHSKSRWISGKSTDEKLDDNTEKVATCFKCQYELKCFMRSMASYTYQILEND